MSAAWRILKSRVEAVRSKHPLADFCLLLVQHVLNDLCPLVEAFVTAGCRPAEIWVVGIPYSSRHAPGQAIRDLGCKVVLPPVFPFDGPISSQLLGVLAACSDRGKRLLILEDGAYVVPILSQLAVTNEVDMEVVKGAVEQTSRGAQVDRYLQQQGYLRLPVISIPDCMCKQHIEPPAIAEAVVRNLRSLLDEAAPAGGIREIKVAGMFGYGAIGDQVGKALFAQGTEVLVSDPLPGKGHAAYFGAKFDPLTTENHHRCDLILGTTGQMSIGVQVLDRVKDGVILASTSSRQVEIDIQVLYSRQQLVENVGRRGPCVMGIPAARRFHLPVPGTSKSVTVLYDGFPINFWGRSLPEPQADIVLSLLFEGVIAMATGNFPESIVYNGAEVLKEVDWELRELFGECYGDGGATDD